MARCVSLTLDAVPRGRCHAVVRNCFLEETGTHEITVPGNKLVRSVVHPLSIR
jgi:hypothetical protein